MAGAARESPAHARQNVQRFRNVGEDHHHKARATSHQKKPCLRHYPILHNSLPVAPRVSLGSQSRRPHSIQVTSANPPRAALSRTLWHPHFVPRPAVSRCSKITNRRSDSASASSCCRCRGTASSARRWRIRSYRPVRARVSKFSTLPSKRSRGFIFPKNPPRSGLCQVSPDCVAQDARQGGFALLKKFPTKSSKPKVPSA